MEEISKLGKVAAGFSTFKLKSVLINNDAGDWGNEPDENAIGVIRSTNFSNEGKLKISDVAYRTLRPTKRQEKLLFSGDILVERSGGSDSQPVGRVGIIDQEIAKTDYVFANFIQRISTNDSVDPKFLYYCLQQIYEMGITASMQYQTTGIRNLDWKLYTKTILPKPPKLEQTAIATIISKVDEAIEANQNSIKAAEKLKKALMQNLLTGKLKPDGVWRTEDEYYEDEKYGKVPIGWVVKPVGDKSLTHINPNYSFEKNREYDFIPMESIKDKFRGVDFMEHKKIDGGGYTRFKKGDILFAKITPCTENGKIALITEMNSEVGFASTEFIIFSPKETINNQFYYYLLTSDRIHNLAVSLMEGTTGRQRVPWKVFKNRILVPIPIDLNEQRSISENIKAIENSNEGKQSKIKSLQKLKKSLMQHLLTGKIRLPQDIVEKLCVEEEVVNG
jgi:type I restriction enzyme, S subunit